MKILKEAKVIDKKVFDDLELSIEVNAGDTRSGVNKKGERWENKTTASYGYIRGTNSPDGEELDFWLKSNPKEGKRVYVMHQLTPDGSKYDEDKVMLGFSSKEEAIRTFKENVFKPKEMFGGCSEFDMEHFKVIAYQASNSSAMLASQKIFDEFTKKGLLKKNIKSPIQVSKRVKETFTIEYTNPIVVESVVELTDFLNIGVKKNFNKIIFESKTDFVSFVDYVTKAELQSDMLGDIHQAIPESMELIVESNLTDAIDDLKSELSGSNNPYELAADIAKDYGLETDELISRFEASTGTKLDNWNQTKSDRKDALAQEKQRILKQKEQEKEKQLAAEKRRREVAAILAQDTRRSRYGLSKTKIQEYAKNLVDYVYSHLGDVFPDGEWFDVLEKGLEYYDLTEDEWFSIEHTFYQIWKKEYNEDSPNDSMIKLYHDLAGDYGWDRNNNPYGTYKESVELDSLMKLAGVKINENKSKFVTVEKARELVESTNKNFYNSLKSFMISKARKNHMLSESEHVNEFDTVKATLSFINTTLKNPTAPASKVLQAVASAFANGNVSALQGYLESKFGMSVEEFAASLLDNDLTQVSKRDVEMIGEAVETIWNEKISNKADATKAVLKKL